MKKSIFKSLLCGGFLFFAVFANKANAQTNNGINFQAVARDNFSNPAKDRRYLSSLVSYKVQLLV